MKNLTFFTLLVVHLSINAQQVHKTTKWHGIFKYYPLSLFDANVPTIQPAFELRNNRFGIQVTWGFNPNLYTMHDADSLHFPIHANRYRLELKHYTAKKNPTIDRDYYGIALFATIYDKAMDRFEYRDPKIHKTFLFKQGIIHKKAYGIVFKGGKFIPLGKRTAIEISPELGIRLVKTKFTDLQSVTEVDTMPRNSINPESATQGIRVKPHPGFIASITYRLF